MAVRRRQECDNWLKEQAEKEADLSIYEKKIDVQLDVSLSDLRTKNPQDPACGVQETAMVKTNFGLDIKGIWLLDMIINQYMNKLIKWNNNP